MKYGIRQLTDEQKAKLDTLSFLRPKHSTHCRTSFDEIIRLLEEYKAEYHHCDVPRDYKVGTINLGQIVKSIRSGDRKTTPEQKAKLDTLGFIWKKKNIK